MTYDGNTTALGPAHTRETRELWISKLTVGPFGNNSYLLRDKATGQTLLIDAANDADRILDLCDGRLNAVLTTHCHADHWQALADVVAATGATTFAHPADAPEIPVPTQVFVADGDHVAVGNTDLVAVHLIGHTDGSIALIHRDTDGSTHVFTGDCLFPGGIGNTFEDPTRFDSLLAGVTTKLFDQLPDDAQIYPGHGDDTTIGAERPSLAEWTERGW